MAKKLKRKPTVSIEHDQLSGDVFVRVRDWRGVSTLVRLTPFEALVFAGDAVLRAGEAIDARDRLMRKAKGG